MNRKMMFGLLILAAVGVFAEPKVTDVRVTSRKDLLEDQMGVRFTVSGVNPADHKIYALTGEAKNLKNGAVKKLPFPSCAKISSNGVYRVKWDAKTDLKSVDTKQMNLKLALVAVETRIGNRKGVRLWAGGPYWAEMNVGATKPEEAGYYFWWGDAVGYKHEGGHWVASDGSDTNFLFVENNTPTFSMDFENSIHEDWCISNGDLAPKRDAAQKYWGKDWRMPTISEIRMLIQNTDTTWATRNGVRGRLVKGRGAYSSVSIFLPAAGYGDGGKLNDSGSDGHYWSLSPDSDGTDNSWRLYFSSTDFYWYDSYRSYGHTIRPLAK